MIPELDLLVRTQDPALTQGKLSFIKLHNGTGFRNPKVSFVVMDAGRPVCFLKSVRFPQDNAVIDRAHDRLRRINATPSVLHGSTDVPRPLWISSCGSHHVCAESIVAGRPLNATVEIERNQAYRWLDAFAQGNVSGMMSASDVRAAFQQMLTEMRCEDAEWLRESAQRFEELLAMAGGETLQLPRIAAHGDATPSNILYTTQGTLSVIDWDRYADITFPMFDVLTFVERSAPKKSNMFAVREAEIRRHAQMIGVAESAIPLCILFYIILSDWRKRECMFSWEPALWDQDTLALTRRMLPDALAVFAR